MNRRLIIISMLILALAAYIQFVPFQTEVPLKKSLAELPVKWKSWVGREMFFNEVILDKMNVSDYTMRNYKKEDSSVSMYIGYYSSQKKNAQIHSPKHCLPGSGWLILSERKRVLNIDGIGDVLFVESVYQKDEGKVVFYYWYQMKEKYIANEYALKMYMIFNSLRYGRNDAAFIRLSSPIVNNIEETRHGIEDFMDDILPLLQEYLPG